ncbi:MAG TPA: hypothetical protein VGQ53_16680, partial [Chitinophagaceae bacterium]|nr:hypothetical protein [Chitinophagaceae bacterium]
MTNSRKLILFFFFIVHIGYTQTLTFEVPAKINAQVGHELSVRLNVVGIKKYSITVEGNPISSYLRNNRFIWTPKVGEAKIYLVKFFLQDSLGNRINEAEMALSTDSSPTVPELVFDRALPDTIMVVENGMFFISAAIKSGNGTDPKTVAAYFLFNENADLRSFDSCRVSRMGDQILFGWTPSNREAVQGYAKFRITLVSSDNVVGSKVLNFKIKNINEKPKFVNEIPDTVFIPTGGNLVLDISAVDPDGDKLEYDFFPKGEHFYLEKNKIIIKPDAQGNDQNEFPIHLLVSVTDGEYSIKRSVLIRRNKFIQLPSIGDFTRDEFYEGDSLVTYLNISNDSDPKQYEIKFSDLALPPGIGAITSRLVFEKGLSYIKVKSKGILPYYLVDRDYNYDVAVTLSSKEAKLKPVFKVLELKVKDRTDPTSVGHQKDSLI